MIQRRHHPVLYRQFHLIIRMVLSITSALGFLVSYVDIEGVYKTESDLIRRYRSMALYPECDSAIEDIVNEAIVSDTDDSPVTIELSNLNASDGIKKED